MKTVLFAWIGITDLRARQGVSDAGLGPIGQAVALNTYETSVLLSDHSKKDTESYRNWVQGKTSSPVECVKAELSGPMHFGRLPDRPFRALRHPLQCRCVELEAVPCGYRPPSTLPGQQQAFLVA